ncbi:PepSY-associated TM helix domain-containing protein [Methylophaga sp.]|uniref:PepSY-associated TM helix domain-containing protein n=1 Tax=Methylophaga sp. TaxID=2024840 RepID=UPI0013FEAB05|nr:PepSY-associated TM helix domain-containing protein [Methylophaga sp.]MTI63942.1 PepSY domain-containing protein [Methylophaga sp.]
MRRFWIEFHKISGLIILIPLLLQSISGSIIVFDHAIDEWLNPEILLIEVPPDGEPAPLSQIMATASSALPQTVHISSLRKPRHGSTVFMAYPVMQASSPHHGKRMEVLINPYTAEVTGIREWGSYFTSFIYRLHFTLLLDRNGSLFLGFLALVLLVNLIIGVYLGWPRSRAARDWLLARKHRKTPLIGKLRRWHILCGLTALPVSIVLIISGVSMIFHDQTEALLNRPAPPQLDVKLDPDKIIDINDWLPAVSQHWPNAEWMRVSQPTQSQPVAAFILRTAGDPRKTSGSSMLWLHPQSSQILAEQHYADLSFRQKIAFWLFPLHSGEAFAMPGRLLVFLCGLLLSVLSIAGLWLWCKRTFRHQTAARF